MGEKQRKLFCERGPICYQISLRKEAFRKNLRDMKQKRKFAKKRQTESLAYIWKGDTKELMRRLAGVDMQLQKNKVRNLQLACNKIDGLVIQPGEEFSFWNLVGNTTKRKGYLEGLVISNSHVRSGYGGGLCQLANMIHWLVLHTPLTVTELHHHTDALFPDSNRRVPFGTGTSISYKALDYRFKNTTQVSVQLRLWMDEEFLYGEIRGEEPLQQKYRILEEDHCFTKDEHGEYYRNSRVYRLTLDRATKEIVEKELVLRNHSKVMYDYSMIPIDQIRDTQTEQRIEQKTEQKIEQKTEQETERETEQKIEQETEREIAQEKRV